MKNPGALFREFPPTVRLLQVARVARSIGQGLTIASFALYLHALGYDGAAIGAVLTGGLMFGAALTAIIGPLSDRLSRRRMLLFYEVVAAAAALAAMLSSDHLVVIASATVAGFGRGANGAAGPFSPVEQAWIAHEVEGAMRRRALSLNATLGFIGMALGAAVAFVPGMISHGETSIETYRLLFGVPFVASLLAIALIWHTRDTEPAAHASPVADTRTHKEITRDENRQLIRLAFVNSINGLAAGIIGPLIAYWFLVRFGVGLAGVGPALAAGFVLAAFGSSLNSRIASRIGSVRAVLWMRGIGTTLMVVIPFVPVFWLAVVLYAIRAACNRGTIGVRQAVTSELTRAERRGFAASVQNLSMQIPRAIGPLFGGWLIHQGDLAIPFFLTAALQALYIALYAYFFIGLDRAEPARAGPAPGAPLTP